jgi:hypothetical protein
MPTQLRQMKKLNLILISLLTFSCQLKGQGIQNIELIFQHSLRIPSHRVEIKAKNRDGKYEVVVKADPMINDIKWSKTKIDTTYAITRGDFDQLKAMVMSMPTTDMIKAMIGSGEDGTTWQLSFGDFQNKITYQIWTIDYRTKERGLEKYANICEFLMTLGRMNYKKIK